MKIRRPSPALVVAIVALVMASTGSAIAAVNFARNAGAVDRLSAVNARASNNRAAGKLVATARAGAQKGRIPAKFLGGVSASDSFGQFAEVQDNAGGAPVGLDRTQLGVFTGTCNDQSPQPGIEDPTVTLTFANTTPVALNFARTVGGRDATVGVIAPGTVQNVTVNGSNAFELHVEAFGVNVIYKGMVRQDGARTPAATCLFVGTVEIVRPS